MDSDILIARIGDTADISFKTSSFKYLGFLSSEERILAEKILLNKNVKHGFFGGYDTAQRVVLCCLPDWAQDADYPICPLTFSFRKSDKLSHRDFLGSLTALGIKRETIGDILIEDGRAVTFVLDEVSDYILNQIKKIGRVGVEIKTGFDEPLPQKNELCEFTTTVASERLDGVVSSLVGCSRSKASKKIELGLVNVNSVVCQKVTKRIENGDAISVKGHGKFFVESIDAKTKKNRIVLKYKKYL